MPNPRISFECHKDTLNCVGFVIRTTQTDDSTKTLHILSRLDGVWLRVTAEQIREHDIPSECLFPVDEIPESFQNSGYRAE